MRRAYTLSFVVGFDLAAAVALGLVGPGHVLSALFAVHVLLGAAAVVLLALAVRAHLVFIGGQAMSGVEVALSVVLTVGASALWFVAFGGLLSVAGADPFDA